MYVLGFDCYGHDSAAAILKDGELVAWAEEERFSRKKHTAEFPEKAIAYCLREAGIEPAELDHVGYYWNPSLGLGPRFLHVLRYLPGSLRLVTSRTEKFLPMLRIPRTLRTTLRLDHASAPEFHFCEHHVAHAASTFYPSPFDRAAILSVDAAGEWATAWLGIGEGTKLTRLGVVNFPHSLGMLYGAMTEFLGFKFANGEGKVMGLAPYGDPERFYPLMRSLVDLREDGGFRFDLSHFEYHVGGYGRWMSKKFEAEVGPPRERESEIRDRDKDLAAALQKVTEEVGLHMARYLHRVTGEDKLCLAGGVALNSVMNGRVLTEGPYEDLFIQPASNDAGTALGAALLLDVPTRGERRFRMSHPYWGPSYAPEEVEAVLPGAAGITWERLENPHERAAKLLADGQIVGWFQGRMEIGPRALGNRSILADPRRAEMKDILNSKVKHRESFRPFAPSVLEEDVGDYFECSAPSPYMILVYGVRPEKRSIVPAITHVDGTGRVQTVSRQANPRYWGLINEFRRLTGVPVILNTSFNVRGQPIVCSPQDALETFLATQMDALFLGDYLVTKTV
jgi:carbamoyltransferase